MSWHVLFYSRVSVCVCECMWVNNVIYYALLSGISGIYRARDTTHKCCHKFCTAAPQDPRLHQCVCEWVECSSRLLGIPGYDSSDDVFTAVSRGTYSCSNNLQFICHIYIHIARVCVCVCVLWKATSADASAILLARRKRHFARATTWRRKKCKCKLRNARHLPRIPWIHSSPELYFILFRCLGGL